jgi:hypothetical protein
VLTARAMVLGSLIQEMSYPKSLYLSGQAYGFTYFPLMVDPPGAWDDNNNRWLASLYGLSYERIMADEDSYFDDIWKYLRQGLPVMACHAWYGVSETADEMRAGDKRIFWWEGMSQQARTRIHYLTVVGMDRSNHTLFINDPIYCWHGRKGKCSVLDMDRFKHLVAKTPQRHRYIIKAFKTTGKPAKTEQEIHALARERIIKKLKGNGSVYDSDHVWISYFGLGKNPLIAYGLQGLKVFKYDLKPERFKGILTYVEKNRGIRPVDRLTYLNLMIYHRVMLTSIAAEYLEANNKVEEWKWLFELHMLYEKLWLCTTEICSIFRESQGIDQAVDMCGSALESMQKTLGEMIRHIERYVETNS